MTTETQSGQGKRSIEQIITVNAPVEAVWKALTDAEELVRWFPVEARVTPGVGGMIWTKWSEKEQWEQPITIWEDSAHLRTLWCERDTPEPEQFGVDFFLSSEDAGTTRLRVVHFGFGPAQEEHWDTMYDGVNRGWDFQLFSLRHYLERHLGEPRSIIHVRAQLGTTPLSEVWETLLAPGGFARDGALRDAQPEQPYTTTLVTGETLRGTVRRVVTNKDLQATVENVGDSYIRFQTDPCGAEVGNDLSIFFGAFGIDDALVEEMRQSWQQRLNELFPPSSKT